MGEGGTNERRRKRRWGTAAAAAVPPAAATNPSAPSAAAAGSNSAEAEKQAKILAMQERIRAQLANHRQQGATAVPAATTATSDPAATAEKVKAMQASVQARLQAIKAKQQQASSNNNNNNDDKDKQSQPRPAKRAKHFDLDMTVTGPSFAKTTSAVKPTTTAAPKKKVNPYLSRADDDDDAVVDDRVGRAGKDRPRHKAMKFIQPGHFSKLADRKREKIAKAQEAGFLSGRKTGHSVQSTGMAFAGSSGGSTVPTVDTVETLAPRWDAHPDTKMPLAVEWWDVELLPSKLKKKVAAAEAQALSKQSKAAMETLQEGEKDKEKAEEEPPENLRTLCFDNAKLSYSRTSELVQHIVPVKPPTANTGPAKEQVMPLTKKERRRQRKLRRQDKQREQQDLQAAGLIPAPEPRLTLQNFMRVLGDQAYLDPSQVEKKVVQQVEARMRAHIERNEANKLTKEQRAAKRAKKLEEDTTTGSHVAVFYVKDMSHPYHRAKVDLNAQQFNITGGVVESQNPSVACVICEGGPKAIKKFIRLMTIRMKWTGPDDAGEDSDEDIDDGDEEGTTRKFNPENTCELVWQGMVVKRIFNGFIFQSCETPDQARRVLKAKGVAHYWDQVAAHENGQSNKLGLRLADDSDDDNPYQQANDEEDIVMKE